MTNVHLSSPVIQRCGLLALVYPGLGRLVDRDAIRRCWWYSRRQETGETEASPLITSYIDCQRTGLLADFCFEPHPEHPNLLPPTTYDRWDRLGYAAITAYQEILRWLEMQRSQQKERLLPSQFHFR